MNKFTKFLFVLALASAVLEAKAQIVVSTTTYTAPDPATSLVNNVLLGTGVTASNIVFTPGANANSQLGYFNGSNSNIGLDSGIVLSSGNVADVVPNSFIGLFGSNTPNPDLLSVAQIMPTVLNFPAPMTTWDAAILEFDFVPSSDTVKFRYVFGSNEYNTFINTQYNDVFGFFISGPGITGPYSGNSKNIALVPNTNPPLPISISSVHNGNPNAFPNPIAPFNQQYFVDNAAGTTVALNGFTTVFTAISAVTCGLTYHIRIAISDCGDGSLDSGVFLEANSFSSQGVQLTGSVSIGGTDSILYEGCGVATIEMMRPGDVTLGDTVHFIIGGSPNNGDYTNFADSLVYQPGQQSAFLNINAYQDNTVEGLDTITITTIGGVCSTLISTITMYIADVPAVFANAGNDTILKCAGDPATLHASAVGGLPGYFYTWQNGLGSSRIITVNPTVTTSYVVMVQDTCQQVFDYDTIVVNIPVVDPITVTGSPDQDIVCPNQPATFTASAIGGTPPYTFSWQNPFTPGNTATFITPEDQWYVAEVTDACNILHGYDTVRVNLIEVNQLTAFLPEEIKICLGESATTQVEVYGGVQNFNYTWTNVTSNLPSITVAPTNNSIYFVTVNDSCGNTTSASVLVSIKYPVADFSYTSDPMNDYNIIFTNSSLNPVTNLWDFADGETSLDLHPTHIYADSGSYDVNLVMQDTSGCVDTVQNTVWVNPDLRVLIPSAFTPNGDGLNDVWEIHGQGMEELSFIIFDRWGGKIYDNGNMVSNNKWEGKEMPQGIYSYKISAKSFTGRLYNKHGSITLIR
jgi:gliding motility-associated-like protein